MLCVLIILQVNIAFFDFGICSKWFMSVVMRVFSAPAFQCSPSVPRWEGIRPAVLPLPGRESVHRWPQCSLSGVSLWVWVSFLFSTRYQSSYTNIFVSFLADQCLQWIKMYVIKEQVAGMYLAQWCQQMEATDIRELNPVPFWAWCHY